MDRRDRNFQHREEHGHDYDRYEGYNRDDEHYHRARNLTDEFEQDFQRERGHWNDNRNQQRVQHTYHEGDMGDTYERLSRQDRDYRSTDNDWDRNRDFSGDSGRRTDYWDNDRTDQDRRWSGRDRGNSFDDRDHYGDYTRDDYRRDNDFRSGNNDRGSRYREEDRDRRNENSWYNRDRGDYNTTRYY